MEDANDTLYTEGRGSLSVMPSIEDKDPLSSNLSMPRVNQQGLIAGSVTARILGNIFTSTAPNNADNPTTSSPIPIPTGSSRSFLFTVADAQGKAIVAIPQPVIYTGSISPANQWPSVAYNMTNLPVCVFNDPTLSNGSNIVTRVEVGNNSLSTVLVVVTCSWRIITQPNTAFSLANATPSVAAIGP